MIPKVYEFSFSGIIPLVDSTGRRLSRLKQTAAGLETC